MRLAWIERPRRVCCRDAEHLTLRKPESNSLSAGCAHRTVRLGMLEDDDRTSEYARDCNFDA
jgi:hypothetical protein